MRVSSRFASLGLLVLLLVAACGSPRGVDRPLSTATVAAHLNRLILPADDTDRGPSHRAAAYAVEQLESAGVQAALTTAFPFDAETEGAKTLRPPVFRLQPGEGGHVVGYVTGRDASLVDRLVLLTADLNSPGGAALLEAARLLAAEARWGPHPKASVGVALWSRPRPGPMGVSDFIQHPTWSLDAIDRVLWVTPDTTGGSQLRSYWAAVGIPMEIVSVDAMYIEERTTPPSVAMAFRLAESAIAAARRAADIPLRGSTSIGP